MNADWFAGRLQELRAARGWTQQELADAAGLALGGIRNLEQGRRVPGWDTVLLLCQALGVGCEAFCQEPATSGGARMGRPKKEESKPEEPATKPIPKRKRT